MHPPLPDYLISVNLLLCEKVLRETDNVSSAIRILNTFYIPQSEIDSIEKGRIPIVSFVALVIVTVTPGHMDPHTLELALTNTEGERTLNSYPMTFTSTDDEDHEFPGGGTAAITMNLGIKNLGICYLTAAIDGVEVTKVPLILRRQISQT